MATCESTSRARLKRTSRDALFAEMVSDEEEAVPLFVRSGRAYRPVPDSAVLDCAQRLVSAQFRPGALVLSDPDELRRFLMLKLGPRDREVFAGILLDARFRLIEYVELFEGSVGETAVFPREVVRCVLGKKAAAVVLAHNHPSGGAEPSAADRAVTVRLKEALRLIDVRVVDHFIVGERVCSMRERGG